MIYVVSTAIGEYDDYREYSLFYTPFKPRAEHIIKGLNATQDRLYKSFMKAFPSAMHGTPEEQRDWIADNLDAIYLNLYLPKHIMLMEGYHVRNLSYEERTFFYTEVPPHPYEENKNV